MLFHPACVEICETAQVNFLVGSCGLVKHFATLGAAGNELAHCSGGNKSTLFTHIL